MGVGGNPAGLDQQGLTQHRVDLLVRDGARLPSAGGAASAEADRADRLLPVGSEYRRASCGAANHVVEVARSTPACAAELMALRWRDVDLAAGELHVERSYDPKEREFVSPKSRAGRRRVPIAGLLRGHLRALALVSSHRSDPETLVFGDAPGKVFDYDAMFARVRKDWKTAELAPIGLHAARHTAASVISPPA